MGWFKPGEQMTKQQRKCAACIWNERGKTGEFMCILPRCIKADNMAQPKADNNAKRKAEMVRHGS